MLDVIVAIVLVLLLSAGVGGGVAFLVTRGPRIMSHFFGLSQGPDPLPPGIQEEDPPPRWKVGSFADERRADPRPTARP
jgi:hypothetical protein